MFTLLTVLDFICVSNCLVVYSSKTHESFSRKLLADWIISFSKESKN